MCEVVLGRSISCLDLFLVAVHFLGCFRLFHAVEILKWVSVAIFSCCFCMFLQTVLVFKEFEGVFGEERLFRFFGRSIKFSRLHWVVQLRYGDGSTLL